MKGRKKLERWIERQGIGAEIIPTGEETASVDSSAEVLDIKREDIVKSVVFTSDKGPIMAIIQGTKRVSEKKLKKAIGADWIRLASPEQVEEVTGYAVGGVPPVGHENDSLIYILDEDVLEKDVVFAGGGDETSQLKIEVVDIQERISPVIADIGET